MTGLSSKQATSEDVECGLFSEGALVICIELQEIREEGPTAAAEYLLAQIRSVLAGRRAATRDEVWSFWTEDA